MKKRIAIAVLVILALFLPIVMVHANVPSVINITRRTENGNTLVDVKVSHSDPSTSHYIAQINLDLDGTTKPFTNLSKATTTEATYTLNIGQINPKTVKAQAICIIHGPGDWFTESATGGSTGGSYGGGGIPAYPIESIVIGAILAVAIILLSKKH